MGCTPGWTAGWTVVGCGPACTAGWTVVDCAPGYALLAGSAPAGASVPAAWWVCWVQVDPSHQRSNPGTP